MSTVEESNLSSVMFVVFLLLHNAIVLENFLLLQELASIQRWASKNISKSVTFWTPKYACKNVCLIKELRALPFNANYTLNTFIECLPFLSIFSTRFRRDLLFYCFVPNRSISTVTVSLQTLVKCKKCSDKYAANRFENDYNNLSRHVASFFKKRFWK